jgi:putative RNA 2'-phosphotransferase
MLSEKEITRLSKFLSLVLRHKPEEIGITLDENGWTDVGDLISKAAGHGIHFTPVVLKHIVDTNSKKRFAFNATFDKIRASQGHSVDIDIAYEAQMPPAILYHGTAEKVVAEILRTGIEKRQRRHVHLSADLDTAINVGQRHGRPVVLEVLAAQMSTEGFEFYLSENKVWLTDSVPARYLRIRE